MDKSVELFGRTIVVAGFLPALLWLVLNVAFFWQPTRPFEERLLALLNLQALVLITSVAAALGVLLYAFNNVIIHWYEGAYAFQRRWLLGWAQRRNERRNERLYHSLVDLRRMHQEALTSLDVKDGRDGGDMSRRLDSARLASDQAHHQFEQEQALRQLPVNRKLVMPTALGNAYAVMEEYPYERYGMDSMVFWPRLIAVLPAEYRQSIGDQKTTCDFLLNTSLVLVLFAAQAAATLVLVALGVIALQSAWLGRALLLALPLALAGAYGFYRAAVSETHVLGKLIATAFDLYRHTLLGHFGIEPPARLSDERLTWRRLAAFIRRGDAFYHPAEVSTPMPDEAPARQPSSPAATSSRTTLEH
jgi:hypothetical protein